VVKDIEVKFGRSFKKMDTEITKSTVHPIEWNALIPNDKALIKADNGWLCLTG
jgi:hypothetical protein